MFKKKTRKLSHMFCKLKNELKELFFFKKKNSFKQLKEFFLFCLLESGMRKEGT